MMGRGNVWQGLPLDIIGQQTKLGLGKYLDLASTNIWTWLHQILGLVICTWQQQIFGFLTQTPLLRNNTIFLARRDHYFLCSLRSSESFYISFSCQFLLIKNKVVLGESQTTFVSSDASLNQCSLPG